MAYTKKQREARQCRVIKSNGERCRGFAKIDSERCSLHSYSHRRELPRSEAERKTAAYRRARRRAEPQRRAVCNCKHLPYPHRFSSSGACPDSPVLVRKVGDSEQVERTRERGSVPNRQDEDRASEKYLRDVGVVIRDEPPALKDYRREVDKETAEQEITEYEKLMSKVWSGQA